MNRIVSGEERIELNALADGELDAEAATALQARIATDPALRAAWEEIVAVRDMVLRLDRPKVSAAARLAIEALAENPAPSSRPVRRPLVKWMAGWPSLAAAVVVTAFVASSVTYRLVAPAATYEQGLIADGHRRSLLAATPVDVASSDRHTVKPWLDARLGVSPPAPDLAAAGYPLIGGRVEVLDERPVPALVYRHNEHIITVAAVPGAAADAAPRDFAAAGYNMVAWRGSGFDFTAVSDLEPAELAVFVADYRAATGPPAASR